MITFTIPKKLVKKGKELVIIPREEYDRYLALERSIPTFKPTRSEILAINGGRKDIKEGKYIEWRQLKHELENLHNRSRRKAN